MRTAGPRAHPRHGRAPWTLFSIGIVVVVAVVYLLWLGGWASPALGGYLAGLASSSLPAIPIAAYLLLIGTAALSVVPAYRWGRASLAIGVAVGMGVSGLIVALAYYLFGNATAVILPLGIAAGAILVVKGVLRLRRDRLIPRAALGNILLRVRSNPDLGTPFVAIAVALAALAPVARYGLTSWTTGTHDLPAYISWVEVWLRASTHGTPFTATHADTFGTTYADGARWDKPTATALLLIAVRVTGLAPYQLELPVMLVLLASLISASAYIVRRVFGLRRPFNWIVATLPALSIVPFSRIIDAQLGQPVVVTALVGFLALWVSLPRARSVRLSVWPLLLMGVVGAAALGADVTLTVGLLPGFAAAMLWLSIRRGVSLRATLARFGLLCAAIVVFCIPLIPKFLEALPVQTNGTFGFSVPLATPLALVGLQSVLFHTERLRVVFAGWALLAAAAALVMVLIARRSVSARYLLVFFAAIILTAVGLCLRYGPNSYIMHKWSAMAIAVLTPVLLAQLLAKWHAMRGKVALTVTTGIAVGSLVIAIAAATAVSQVIPPQLNSLATNSRLSKVPVLNVDLTDVQQAAIAALVVPSNRIVSVTPNPLPASPPVGSQFLIASAASTSRPWTSVTPVNDLYSLATLDLSMGGGTTRFDSTGTASARYLYGAWYSAEPGGTWSGSASDYLVFDPSPKITSNGIGITITGIHFAAPLQPRILSIVANKRVVKIVTSTSATRLTVRFRMTAAELAAAGGRVAIRFWTDQPLSPSAVGQSDPRNLVFQLQSIALAP